MSTLLRTKLARSLHRIHLSAAMLRQSPHKAAQPDLARYMLAYQVTAGQAGREPSRAV